MSDERVCIVRLTDDHGVEHQVKVRAESVYEAALLGLKRLERVGWESDGSTIGSVIVEVWEEPTRHLVHVNKLLSWPKAPKGQMGLASRNGRPSHWFVPWTRLGAGGAVSEVWELGSRAVRQILRNNSGLYWIGRFPILQLSFAIDSRGVLRFLSGPPKPAGTEVRHGNRIGKAGLFQKDDFSHRDYGRRLGVLALSGHG